jgi:hypothetical protein
MVFHNAAGASVGSITENGSNTAYNTSSDRRIKENIATTTLGLDQLMNLPVRSFAFISDPTHATTTGFIAQELYQVFPWAVTPNGDDGSVPLSSSSTPWAVDYGRITPLIVKSVQDLNAKVDSNASSSVRIHDGLITLSLSSATTTIATGTNVWNIATSSATGTIPIISISAPASSTPSVSINGNLYLRGINIGDIMASATATTSTGYFTDANGPFASVSAALKDALNAGLNSISSATQSGVRELGLAVHASVGIFDNIFAKTITADNVEAQTVTADQKLCIGHTCVTEAQLQELLGAQSASAAASTPSGSGSQNSSSTPPVITVNGNNPATVHVGDTYNDLGATISGPQDDLNLGIQASVDNATSTPVADISVDTTQTGTHTIVYSATDQNGLVGTVSRTVNVIDTGSTTSTSPVSDATSTSATSTTP